MEWDEGQRSRLETALNEADVVGIRLEPSGRHVDVLLHVLSLPPNGPLPKDGRRILRLTSPSELRFLLRQDRVGAQVSDQPILPLADLATVEHFFESLSWGGSIYGWRFFDEPELTSDWPAEPSLTVRLRDTQANHTFYWFNECGVEVDGNSLSYCIEGTVAFDDICVLDAGGTEVSVEAFIVDGVHQWDAFYARDERLSAEAQREAQRDAPKWHDWATGVQSATGAL